MRRSRKAINQINVVPYIDVMLVLLVIFMVTAPLITPGEIKLPTVGSALTPPPSPPIEVTVNANAMVSVQDKAGKGGSSRMSLAELVTYLQQKQADAERPVVIIADPGLRYQQVINVIDVLNKGGIKRVGLLAQPKPG